MKNISVNTKIPYFCLTIDFNRLREINTNPEEWAKFLSKIRNYIKVSAEDEPNFFADIDHALSDIMGKTWSATLLVYKQEIELILEAHTLYIIFKYDQLVNMKSEEYV